MNVALTNRQISIVKHALVVLLVHNDMTAMQCYEVHDVVDALWQQFPGVVAAELHAEERRASP